LLLIVVSLSGCFATQKRCLRLYPPVNSTDTVVSLEGHNNSRKTPGRNFN
jgi:hypothetical protein